ncbi:MAG TPA: ABC transporter permease [Stellaceae bacterium]|nr:ABC transporter permease [Stellaceae bacterium]
MTTAEQVIAAPSGPLLSHRTVVLLGRCFFALLLIAGWQWGADAFGSIFFAPPLAVLQRLYEMTISGEMFWDIWATLYVSAIGFVIAVALGLLLPFVLRLSPRLTEAVQPYIFWSQGVPKYALAPWLILWFGIGDVPKLVIVVTQTFYVIFYNVFAGIRAVDGRLINMARIMGASESVIAREVIWKSLQPFFYAAIKIAAPHAVGATIVGEFLVSTRGVGYYIEHARELSDTVGVFAGIVVATVLVLLINMLVEKAERMSLAWRPVAKDMQM